MFALAQDYLRAGIIDRAEDALNGLVGTALEAQAMLALLSLYERSRDWERAAATAKRLETLGEGDFSARLAHYWCEQAAQLANPVDAKSLIEKALQCAPKNARALLALAQALQSTGQSQQSFDTLKALMTDSPRFTGLCASLLAKLAIELNKADEARLLLTQSYTIKPRLDVLEALVLLNREQSDPLNAQTLYAQHLVRSPSLIAATQWLRSENLSDPQTQARVIQTLDKSAVPLKRYRCAACGFEALTHFWQCPGCQAWDSYPPERIEEL